MLVHYMVRHYPRPGQRALRAAAIRALGLTLREAFNQSDDFETLLAALVSGLSARDDAPLF